MPTLPLTGVFAELPDPRRETANKLHRLVDILTIATCAVIAGAEPWKALAENGRMERPTARAMYQRASAEAQLLALAQESPGAFEPTDLADCRAAGDRAMEALQRSVGMGLRDTARLRGETDLEPIRRRADFQGLLLDLDFPAEPFAAAH